MFLKMIGALLLIAGGAYVGGSCAAALRRRVRILSDLISALRLAKAEIVLRLTPMPELLALLGRQSGEAGEAFGKMARKFSRIDCPGLSYIWTKTLEEERERLMLPDEALRVLLGLGDVLGRYSGEEQGGQLDYAAQRLEECRRTAQEACERLGKLYRHMGVAGGAALAILLF